VGCGDDGYERAGAEEPRFCGSREYCTGNATTSRSPRSAISYQLSAISYQLLAGDSPGFEVVGRQKTVFSLATNRSPGEPRRYSPSGAPGAEFRWSPGRLRESMWRSSETVKQ